MNNKQKNSSLKETLFKVLTTIKNWYLKHRKIVNICLLIALGWFVLIIIATRGFQNPDNLVDRIADGIDKEGKPLYYYNPTALAIGTFNIQWYAIFIMYGIISAGFLVHYEIKKKGINTSLLWDGILVCVPLALVGARLYYVFVNWGSGWTFLQIIGWNGQSIELSGMAIHGALIMVGLVLIPFCKINRLNYGFILDVALSAFFIGQAIGRWGNFMNHELYGPMITSRGYLNFLPNFITEQLNISPEMARIGEQYGPRHPTFLYESLFNMLGLATVMMTRRKKIAKVGDYAAFYLIWYGIGRGAIAEPLRYFGGQINDSMLIPGTEFPINVLLSIFMVVGGVLLIVLKRIVFMKNPETYYADYQFKKKVLVKKVTPELLDELPKEEKND